MGNKLRLLKGVLYRLKRSYGCRLAVYKTSTQEVDVRTGRSTIERVSVEVKRAIVLPSQIHRGFTYDIGYLKANSNFTYGGVYTDETRVVIIDAADLPADFQLTAKDKYYVVYDGNRWELKTVEKLEFGLGSIVSLERVDGAINDQIVNLSVRDRFQLHQFASFVGKTAQLIGGTDQLVFDQTVVAARITIHHQSLSETLHFLENVGDQ